MSRTNETRHTEWHKTCVDLVVALVITNNPGMMTNAGNFNVID